MGFLNCRAWWWWTLREALDPESGEDLAIPPDRGLLADLTAPRWRLSTRGVQVEAKADIIARLGRSPDKGDSLVYALARPSMKGAAFLELARRDMGAWTPDKPEIAKPDYAAGSMEWQRAQEACR